MTRTLTAAAALAITAVMVAAVARANPPHQEIVAPPARLAQAKSLQPIRWHYEWQNHFDKWGQYVPGWVAVSNNAR